MAWKLLRNRLKQVPAVVICRAQLPAIVTPSKKRRFARTRLKGSLAPARSQGVSLKIIGMEFDMSSVEQQTDIERTRLSGN